VERWEDELNLIELKLFIHLRDFYLVFLDYWGILVNQFIIIFAAHHHLTFLSLMRKSKATYEIESLSLLVEYPR